MNHQEPSGKDGREPSQRPPQREGVQPLDTPPASPYSNDDFAKVQREMNAFERATLRWARTAVIMSGLAALFVCGQWWEMHSGSKDTHDLAVAAGNQATWTQNLATKMQTQADRTKDLADRMKDQADRTKDVADQTRDLANDSAGQLATMRSQLELANRPWLKVVNVTTRDVPGFFSALISGK